MSLDFKIYSPKDFPSYLPKLNQLYDRLFEGGKGFRAALVSQMGSFIDLDESTTRLLAQTVEFIHNSSLLHDDLIDKAPLRRGKPAAWTEFGPEYTVLAGDYLLARVIVNLSEHGHLGLVKVTGEAISDLLEGEWLQDSIRFDAGVTWEQMDRIHRLKTSSLFSWCLKAPFVFKNYSEEVIGLVSEIGDDLGSLLQRSDDLLDFDIRNAEGKTSFTDLKAGYLNLFAIELFKTQELRQKAFEVESIESLYQWISPEQLQLALQNFDNKNQKLIEIVNAKAIRLKELCGLNEDFLYFIRTVSEKIYWRDQRP